METTVEIKGRPVRIKTSRAADRALDARKIGLLAEMELYFSCLIRKKVRFHEATGSKKGANAETQASDQLAVRFRPVMTANCPVDFEGDEVPVQDFPIKKPDAYIPKWLRIDYKRGEWVGEFGYN